MDGYLIACASALWLGILTSISPCPLATNIAAISYIGKAVEKPVLALLSGALYTIGRMIAYIGIGLIIVAGALSIPEISTFLQKSLNKYLGPILIIVGLFLLELLTLRFPGMGSSERVHGRIVKLGIWGAIPLGLIFALSFCPVSAALFFGSLIPLALQHNSAVLFPSVYGIGTALPVFIFAALIAFSTRLVGKAFQQLAKIELWARRITGIIIILVGIYYCLIYIFGVPI